MDNDSESEWEEHCRLEEGPADSIGAFCHGLEQEKASQVGEDSAGDKGGCHEADGGVSQVGKPTLEGEQDAAQDDHEDGDQEEDTGGGGLLAGGVAVDDTLQHPEDAKKDQKCDTGE